MIFNRMAEFAFAHLRIDDILAIRGHLHYRGKDNNEFMIIVEKLSPIVWGEGLEDFRLKDPDEQEQSDQLEEEKEEVQDIGEY